MLIKLDTVTIASESDGLVGLKATKPSLSLSPKSVPIQGMTYARNSQDVHGITFSFSIEATRQFSTYEEAETFFLDHYMALAQNIEGTLKYEDALGNTYGFDNAVLSGVEVVGEIGISTQISYTFNCGEPIKTFPYAIRVAGNMLVGFDDKALILTI